jgi:hypothetical protein
VDKGKLLLDLNEREKLILDEFEVNGLSFEVVE